MILAVLESHCGVRFGQHDVYLNVAGGYRISEPAADIAVAAALVSSIAGIALPPDSVYFGEISLSGAVRAVSHAVQRLKEAEKLGFRQAVVPGGSSELWKDRNFGLMETTALPDLVVRIAASGPGKNNPHLQTSGCRSLNLMGFNGGRFRQLSNVMLPQV